MFFLLVISDYLCCTWVPVIPMRGGALKEMKGIFQASRHDGGRRGQVPGFSIPRTLTKDMLPGVRPSALGRNVHPGEGGCRSLSTCREREGEPTKGQPGSALYLQELLQFSQQPRAEAVPSHFTDVETESPRDKVACPKLLVT